MTVPSDRKEAEGLIGRLRDPADPNGLILRRQAAERLELYEATISDLTCHPTEAVRLAREDALAAVVERYENALLYVVNEGRVWDERDTPLTIEQILADIEELTSR